jgi:hypothetical protein
MALPDMPENRPTPVVYAPMKTSAGVEIHIAALQANNDSEFKANNSVFQKSLASIEWQ